MNSGVCVQWVYLKYHQHFILLVHREKHIGDQSGLSIVVTSCSVHVDWLSLSLKGLKRLSYSDSVQYLVGSIHLFVLGGNKLPFGRGC